jgi:exodeoxyribonuclease VIII
MRTGQYSDISNEKYHSGQGVSSTMLKTLAQSPLHFEAAYVAKGRAPRKEKAAFSLGTAIHSAVLEPEKFAAEYVRAPSAFDLRDALQTLDDLKGAAKAHGLKVSGTKADLKASLVAAGAPVIFYEDAYAAAVGDRIALSDQDFETATSIAASLRAHPSAKTLFRTGQAEQSFYWEDADTGILCRCRTDWLKPGEAIVDVKSTIDASPGGFGRAVWNYRYWVSAAFYVDGVAAVTGQELPFIFAAWEKTPPYASGFYFAAPDMIAAGRAEYKRLLRVLRDCVVREKWPGYGDNIQPLQMPAFAEIGMAQALAADEAPVVPVF